jgi:hypothetical protein
LVDVPFLEEGFETADSLKGVFASFDLCEEGFGDDGGFGGYDVNDALLSWIRGECYRGGS